MREREEQARAAEPREICQCGGVKAAPESRQNQTEQATTSSGGGGSGNVTPLQECPTREQEVALILAEFSRGHEDVALGQTEIEMLIEAVQVCLFLLLMLIPIYSGQSKDRGKANEVHGLV